MDFNSNLINRSNSASTIIVEFESATKNFINSFIELLKKLKVMFVFFIQEGSMLKHSENPSFGSTSKNIAIKKESLLYNNKVASLMLKYKELSEKVIKTTETFFVLLIKLSTAKTKENPTQDDIDFYNNFNKTFIVKIVDVITRNFLVVLNFVKEYVSTLIKKERKLYLTLRGIVSFIYSRALNVFPSMLMNDKYFDGIRQGMVEITSALYFLMYKNECGLSFGIDYLNSPDSRIFFKRVVEILRTKKKTISMIPVKALSALVNTWLSKKTMIIILISFFIEQLSLKGIIE